jgi:hypothetical protein
VEPFIPWKTGFFPKCQLWWWDCSPEKPAPWWNPGLKYIHTNAIFKKFYIKTILLKTKLWIRISKDPKLFTGSGSGTRGYGSGSGSGSGTGLEPCQKSS